MFDVEEEVILRESYGMKIRTLARAEELATEHREFIIGKWNEYFG